MNTKRIVFVPFVSFVIIIISVLAWILGMVCVASMGEITGSDDGSQYRQIKWDVNTQRLAWCMFFGVFWILAFILACTQFVIISSCAIWYFNHNTDRQGEKNISKGFYWIFRYNGGSLAFGSFILAAVWFIRALFEIFRKGSNAEGNAVSRCIFCCISCCLACIDRTVRFVNRNAYI